MRKIFHFDSPDGQYVADAAVLCCFDHRISQVVRKFLKKQGIERMDMIDRAEPVYFHRDSVDPVNRVYCFGFYD